MASKRAVLADALEDLHRLQQQGELIVRSGDIAPERVRLLTQGGWLRRVIKGWYHLSDPAARPGDTTPWTMSFWAFVAKYCEGRFGADWVLSPEVSLGLHAGHASPPDQVVVQAAGGGNHAFALPAGKSLFDLRVQNLPAPGRRMRFDNGLRAFTQEATLIHMAENCYLTQAASVAALLGRYRTVDPLLRTVVEGAHKRPGGRLVGALRHLGMTAQADRLLDGMRRASIDVRPEDPFLGQDLAVTPGAAPVANLLRAIWRRDRGKVEANLPAPSGPREVADVLARIDEVYAHDAWNSLSIEGYRVTTALIEKVRDGRWDPGEQAADRADRDAMAARGYWNVFQAVKDVVATSVRSTTPVSPRAHLDDWHQELFEPSVTAGIVTRAQLAGYRNHPVFIRSAQHVPPAAEKLMDAMDAWFDLMDEEPHPGVRAVLGHWLLGYLHPFPDGNGRLARFVMNAVLASSGYEWVVIRLDERARYMAALDSASAQDDIEPFARLIAEHLSAGR